MIKTLEKDIQLSICEYLKARRHFFWRNNNISVYDNNRKIWRKMPTYALKGVPDIIVIWNGKFVGIEVKTTQGIQSDDQKLFEKNLKVSGGTYVLARSIEDVMRVGL